MPHNKHAKNSRPVLSREDTNNNIVHVNENNANGVPAGARRDRTPQMYACCMPPSCAVSEELIDPHQPGNAVRVFCNNDQCTVGNWMHKSCFDEWEQSVLSYLRSCGRARSWSEKQRLQNLWTKKGYDLAFKACDCKCGRGHLRKDLDYFQMTPNVVDNAGVKKKKKKPQTPNPAHKTGEKTSTSNGSVRSGHVSNGGGNANAVHGGSNSNANHHGRGGHSSGNQSHVTNGNAYTNGQRSQHITIINNNHNLNENGSGRGHPSLRLRTDSVSSTGSSPPDSASSFTSGSGSPVPPPLSPLNVNVVRPITRPKFDFMTPPEQNPNVNGTIFRRRHDLSAFDVLPKHKQNPYHIKMEDDGPPGNDDTRNFVLSHLNSYKVCSLKCVLCKNDLPIFDRYPLIDGTFFLSPQAYDEGVVQVISDGRLQFINAVCVSCLEGGKDIRCAACKRKWDGSALLLGSMYAYDIFAAMPCCQKRLTCKHCRRAVVDVNSGLPYYSEYSHMITCPYCKAYDYHFIRPLNETFNVKQQKTGSIWN